MKNNIKELYGELNDKETFIKTLAKEYGITENSVRVNWITMSKIPDDKLKRVHELLTNALIQQCVRIDKLTR